MNYACRHLPFPKFLHNYFCQFLCFLSHITWFEPCLVPLGYHLEFGLKGAIGSEPYATRATVCPLGILLCCALVASLSDCVYALPAVLYAVCLCVHMLCAVCVLCYVCYVLCVMCPLRVFMLCSQVILVIFLAQSVKKSRFMRVI